MKVIGDFAADCPTTPLSVEGQNFRAVWDADAGYVEIPGLTEYRVRVDDQAGAPVVYMRWLVADLNTTGDKDGLLDSLASHSPEGADWAKCLARNCEGCSRAFVEGGAMALLSIIAADPAYKGHGLGTPLAKAFARAVLAPRGVRAIWIKPVPLRENAVTGIFKPKYDPATADFSDAKARLEKHYERSLDAAWTCPDFLRADLDLPPQR